ncbi:hypothetical protein [Aestuariivita sp.]|jgi:hypothetical protein|uniref:hypothetical protein n=1 Tax=Aestuariivita sp. TaxID=1872407 RepID=UPI002171D5A5|nr:hypothetical protein [Aestuariivita sp.]MCE8007910.1 hypothetical protein [Aestuariivita sp.]
MILTAITLLVLVALSLAADSRFRAYDLLPMQFGPTGGVGWSAPRALALSFMPVLSALMMIPAVFLTDDPSVIPIMAIGCLVGHLLHLGLIARHLRR